MTSLRFGSEGYLLAAGTRDAFGRLSDDLVAEGLPPMTVNYGDREPADEVTVFLSRYRLQATGGGPFNDVRKWQGRRYVRFSGLGTVAAPGTSNHGKRRSADLAYPYNSDTRAHRRAQQLAREFNITCEGLGFRNPVEWWHWTFWGVLGTIGQPASEGATDFNPPPTHTEDDMPTLITSAGGQSLVVGNQLIGFGSPDEVRAVKGAQTLEVHQVTHYNLIQAFQRANAANAALPVVVYVRDGDGTVYLLDDGKLEALVDPTTLNALHAQNAPTLTLSQAEVDNLLKVG